MSFTAQLAATAAFASTLYVLHKWWDNFSRLKNIPIPVRWSFSTYSLSNWLISAIGRSL